ncbi:hypothetical protein F5883DRAFT_382229, partial [Diaporthe sp. PMI_573]
TLLAAAVLIGCFSWPALATIFWLCPACWYSSLVLSLFSVLLFSSEAFVIASIRESPQQTDWKKQLSMFLVVRCNEVEDCSPALANSFTPTCGSGVNQEALTEVEVRWNMVFTWKAQIM